MKQLIALAIATMSLVLVGPAAVATDTAECQTIPALPNSCLDQATIDYITGLQNENAGLEAANIDLRIQLSATRATLEEVRAELLDEGQQLILLRGQLSAAQSDRDVAVAAANFWHLKADRLGVVVDHLRLLVRHLRHRLHELI